MSVKLHPYELEEKISRLNGSQEAFIWTPEKFAVIAGGFASGKTTAGVLKGLILSAIYPGNQGIIGRYRGTDLEDSTKPVFFDICPTSWIPKRGGYNKGNNTVTLINGSKIYFRHIHDPNARTAKTRRVGANLGWFFLDQLEEMERDHWNAMIGRLRNRNAKKKFGFAALNPNGRDWIQQTFFPNTAPFAEGEYFRTQKKGELLGIMVNSEENRVSNGGFVDDDYFDSLLTQYSPEWVARYIHCSFDDFAGKIYKGYTLDSVHNIDPFPIPSHWDLVVGIDVGGDSPWAVVPNYIDDWGNTVVTEGYTGGGVNVRTIVDWIKTNLPWNSPRTTFIIDPENKVAMIELAEHGIHCRPAKKATLPSILRSGGYFHVNPMHDLPIWYFETQTPEAIARFNKKGSPRTFVFKTNRVYREEHDSYVWSPTKRNEPHKTHEKRFDTCDADRYVKFSRPEASRLPANAAAKYERLWKADSLSAKEAIALDKKRDARSQAKHGTLVREATMEETEFFERSKGKGSFGYEW
jgi:hypothetical protein